jgi:hypothetical protein
MELTTAGVVNDPPFGVTPLEVIVLPGGALEARFALADVFAADRTRDHVGVILGGRRTDSVIRGREDETVHSL